MSFLSRPRHPRPQPHLNTLDAEKVPVVHKKFQKIRLMPNQHRVPTKHVASKGLAAKTARLRPESRLSSRRRLDWTLIGATGSCETGRNGAWRLSQFKHAFSQFERLRTRIGIFSFLNSDHPDRNPGSNQKTQRLDHHELAATVSPRPAGWFGGKQVTWIIEPVCNCMHVLA